MVMNVIGIRGIDVGLIEEIGVWLVFRDRSTSRDVVIR